LIAGGVGTSNSATVDLFDALSGTWTTGSLSAARRDLAATSAGGEFLRRRRGDRRLTSAVALTFL